MLRHLLDAVERPIARNMAMGQIRETRDLIGPRRFVAHQAWQEHQYISIKRDHGKDYLGSAAEIAWRE
jgi:hypothetical protein